MSSFGGDARSSAFYVKDKEAFINWAESMEIEVEQLEDLQFVMWREDYGLPWTETFFETLSTHLAEDSVAILMRSGLDCSGYPTASAVAINSNGQNVRLELEDIYKKAKKLGGTFEEL
jgi:hypothetical protein